MNTSYEQDIIYSPAIDLLVIWGGHVLERPDVTEEKDILSDLRAAWNESELLDDLRANYPRVLNAAEKARHYFDATPLLPDDYTDSRWIEAVDFLGVFDHLLWLKVAAEGLPAALATEIGPKLDQACEDIWDWIADAPEFTSLRLTPLNGKRQSRISVIPETVRYLYPWYTELAELADDTLAQISAHWAKISAAGYSALDFIPQDQRALVWDGLKRDSGLQAALNTRMAVDRAIIKAIDGSLALRLFYAAQNYALDTDVPDEIASAGLAPVACAILTGRELAPASPDAVGSHLVNQLQRASDPSVILLTAFCGPYLSDAQRLNAFKWVANRIAENAFALGGTYGFLTKLELWRNHEVTDQELAESLLAAWYERANAVLAPAPKAAPLADQMKELLAMLLNFGMQISYLGRNALAMLVNSGMPPSYLRRSALCCETADFALTEGEAVNTQPPQLLFEDSNMVEVRTDIHGQTLNLFGAAAENPRLEALQKDLQAALRYYLLGWGLRAPDTVEPFFTGPKRSQGDTVAIPKEYEAIVFALSDNSKILKKVAENANLSEEEAQQVKWIVYLPEETP